MAKAGEWEFKVWSGGWPVTTEIHFKGEEIARVRHTELRDLEYVVKRAILECRDALPESCKHEMD
jgi:hypothetical protein